METAEPTAANHADVRPLPIVKIYRSPHQMRPHFNESALKERSRTANPSYKSMAI